MGFTFTQTLRGNYILSDSDKEKPITIQYKGTIESIVDYLFDYTAFIEGSITANGLTEHAQIDGYIEAAVLERKTIVYDFDFEGEDKKRYRFKGEINLELKNPLDSFTTMYGKIIKQGKEVGRAILKIDLKNDLIPFIRSIKFS